MVPPHREYAEAAVTLRSEVVHLGIRQRRLIVADHPTTDRITAREIPTVTMA
jgi:hypothetical protein